MREEDVQHLLRHLTSFYQEYLPMDSSLEKLLRSYISSIEKVQEDMLYYAKHIFSEDTPTLKSIPFAKINIASGLYSKSIANSLKGQPIVDILAYLTERKLYVELYFSEEKTRVPVIYNLQLKKDYFDEEELHYYEDFFLRDNRIYFLPKFILEFNSQTDELIATNIRINNYLLEQKWGYLFDLEVENLLPRFRYRDALNAFLRLMSSNLTIKDIREAIQLATKWENFDLQDIKSPSLPVHRKRLYDDWFLSPAEFILTIEEDMIKDKIMLNIILSLIDEAKEVQTGYILMYLIIRSDMLDLFKADESIVKNLIKVDESLVRVDELRPKIIIRVTDFFTNSLLHQYDVGTRYDGELIYDYTGINLQTDSLAGYADEAVIRAVEFPKIPRNVSFTKQNENIICSFDENNDGSTRYQLFGKQEERDEFALLEESPVGVNAKNTIIHNASVSRMRYYKIRAISSNKLSLFTIPTYI